ncbi:MAG: hypothetical protein ACD_60C00125G0015 [uncultured bacterium]|nr:MAG: hypothetical protein ACD_60C00125G0015 [uncultured bacterium]
MHRSITRSKRTNFYTDIALIKNALSRAKSHMAKRATKALSGTLDNVKEKTDLLQENITDYVVHKPIKSLGLAVLMGTVIGYFIHK